MIARLGEATVELLLSDAHATYPHANGFLQDGRVLLARPDRAAGRVTYVRVDPGRPGIAEPVLEVALPQGVTHLFFDVARGRDRLAYLSGGSLWAGEVRVGANAERVWSCPPGGSTLDLPSLAEDGREALVSVRFGTGLRDRHELHRIDLGSGRSRVVVAHDWCINHVHFSPCDPSWIAYCHEGSTEEPERVWAWHAEHAPSGVLVFDQAVAGGRLFVGHERAAFHAPESWVVAYGVSPVGPRGLWKSDWRGGRALVSAGERDLHCDVSRDGRRAVVDTSGPHDAPGRGWDAALTSDILLIDTSDGTRRFLHRCTHARAHPYHAHPVFSPAGDRVLCNDAVEGGGRVWSIGIPR